MFGIIHALFYGGLGIVGFGKKTKEDIDSRKRAIQHGEYEFLDSDGVWRDVRTFEKINKMVLINGKRYDTDSKGNIIKDYELERYAERNIDECRRQLEWMKKDEELRLSAIQNGEKYYRGYDCEDRKYIDHKHKVLNYYKYNYPVWKNCNTKKIVGEGGTVSLYSNIIWFYDLETNEFLDYYISSITNVKKYINEELAKGNLYWQIIKLTRIMKELNEIYDFCEKHSTNNLDLKRFKDEKEVFDFIMGKEFSYEKES